MYGVKNPNREAWYGKELTHDKMKRADWAAQTSAPLEEHIPGRSF